MTDERPIPPSASRPFVRGILVAVRLAVGYVVAVGAGAIIFAVIGDFTLPGAANPPSRSLSQWMGETANASMMFFMLGLIFGIPYTVIGVLLCHYLLPRNMTAFLAAGALCPGAAIFTFGAVVGGTFWFGAEMLKMVVLTIPSGLAAAYLFGAIGLGYGFGRWRPDVRAA